MKRYDQRTEKQVALQRITHLLDLGDHDLCNQHHNLRCAWSTRTERPGGCTYLVILPTGDTIGIGECEATGDIWQIQIPGLPGVRRRCTRHAAEALRARLWLQKQRLLRGMT